MKACFKIVLWLAAVNAAAVVGIAQQGPLGVEVWDQVPPAHPVLLLSKRDLFTQLVNDVNQQRGDIDKALDGALGRPNMIHKGISLYKINLRLGSAAVKFVRSDVVQIDIPKNYCYFRSTTPTKLGKYADPALELHFDVRLTVALHLPTPQDPRLLVQKATVTVPHLDIKPRNFVSDVGVSVAKIVDFFTKEVTGKSLLQTVFQRYLPINITKAIASKVKPVNDEIAKIVKQGFTPTAKLTGQQLAIVMVNSQQTLTNAGRKIEQDVLNRRSRKRPPATTPESPRPVSPENGQ